MEKLTGPLQKDYKNALIIDNRFDKERWKKNYVRINVVIVLHDCIVKFSVQRSGHFSNSQC